MFWLNDHLKWDVWPQREKDILYVRGIWLMHTWANIRLIGRISKEGMESFSGVQGRVSVYDIKWRMSFEIDLFWPYHFCRKLARAAQMPGVHVGEMEGLGRWENIRTAQDPSGWEPGENTCMMTSCPKAIASSFPFSPYPQWQWIAI